MKFSRSMIVAALFAVLPVSVFAGDKDKNVTPMDTPTSAQSGWAHLARRGSQRREDRVLYG
jgi:predicted secreted protein